MNRSYSLNYFKPSQQSDILNMKRDCIYVFNAFSILRMCVRWQ